VSIGFLELRDCIDAACDDYAAKLNVEPTQDWLVLKTVEEVGELAQALLRHTKRGPDRGLDGVALKRALDDEVADLLGFALILSRRLDVDIPAALERKWHLPERSLR